MRNLIPSYVRVPLLFFIIYGIVEYAIPGEQLAIVEEPLTIPFLILVLLILLATEAIAGLVENISLRSLDEEARARYLAEKEKPIDFAWWKKIYRSLTKAKPIEKEGEIILDHNYDGIRELDNSLPPWWLWGFYATIVFSFIYLVRYHILDAPDQSTEYEIEMAEARTAIEEYKKTAKDLVDFNTVALLTEASDLKAGKSIFEVNCVACHQADGGGGIGPNLTDKHWILGGGIKNVFKTVSEGGRDGKGMVAWKQSLKPSEIAQVASYVLSFQGTTPANPKAAEGEIWVDPDAETEVAPEQVSDSLTVAMN